MTALTTTIGIFLVLALVVGIRIYRHGVKNGLIASAVALILMAIRLTTSPITHSEAAAPAAPREKSALYKLESGAELQVRLAALRKREADLLQRKSELEPGDHAGAQAFTQEIAKYNDDLKPVLEQLKDRPELAE
jgi:hypothetical protein